MIADILQLVVIGLVVGSVIAIGAMGLTLTYGITKFANIAHGDYMTLGMFVTYTFVNQIGLSAEPLTPFSFGWTLIVGMLLSGVIVGAVAAIIDFLVFHRLLKRGGVEFIALVASVGVALIIRSIIQVQWGVLPISYYSTINRAIELPLEIKIKPDQLFNIGLMIVATVSLYLLLYKTKVGKAMRATSDNPVLAEISGINTVSIRRLMWFIGGFLASVAGVMLAVQSQLQHNLGFEFLLPLFSAVILGGIGNPWGALVGALVVGVTQEVSTYWIPSGLKPAVPFVVLTVVLLLRPRGIFGSKI